MAGRKAIRILQDTLEELRQILKYGEKPISEMGEQRLIDLRKSIYEAFPDLDER